jgi:protein ImuB
VRLYNLALGRLDRPLVLEAPETSYEESIEVDNAVEQLEPLLFLMARILNELCRRLESQTRSTNRIQAVLQLEDGRGYTRTLELPVPQNDPQSLLKLLQLDLEAHPAPGAVTGITVRFNPVRPRSTQGGLFIPPAPQPDKLELTLARIRGIVGEANAGSPQLLDTHRPDAFKMVRFRLPEGEAAPERQPARPVALRFYRPPREARVRTSQRVPSHVQAPGLGGGVIEAAGPWRTSGEWWRETVWARDEWDLELTDGGVYRVFCELRSKDWFVEGVYD